MKKKRSSTNKKPPAEPIYVPTRGVVIAGMAKIPGHPCDAKCKRMGHRFQHKFTTPVEIVGLKNGDVLLRPARRR